MPGGRYIIIGKRTKPAKLCRLCDGTGVPRFDPRPGFAPCERCVPAPELEHLYQPPVIVRAAEDRDAA
jgi:hypothetical protein